MLTIRVGEVRGKVVLIKCVGKDEEECSSPITGTKGRGLSPFGTSSISNEYDDQIKDNYVLPYADSIIGCTDPTRYEDYLTKLKTHIKQKAGLAVIEDILFMTWVSFAPPGHECQKHVAAAFNDFLKQESNRKSDVPYSNTYGTGIVIMDFPTKNYIKTTIQFNFRGNVRSLIIYIYQRCDRIS